MIQEIADWLSANASWVGWMAALSAVLFMGTLVAIPIMVVRIPPDYFLSSQKRGPGGWGNHPVIRLGWLLGKNVLGTILILAGAAMLILPGQGLLTILIGIVLLDFPGKYRLERWLVTQPPVWNSIAWLRTRSGRPPLQYPELDAHRGDRQP